MDLLRQVRRASPVRRRLLPEATVLFLLAMLGLRTHGYRRTLERFDRRRAEGRRAPAGRRRARAIGDVDWAVRAVASRLPFEGTCLPRSIAIRHMLGSRGIESVIRFGVRRKEEAISAHAWVEADGKRLGDLPGERLRHEAMIEADQRSSASSTADRTSPSRERSRS